METTPKPFVGSTTVPPDKSISHRALMLAAMAEGTSHLRNLLNSQDVRSTASCMASLGADVKVVRQGELSFDADVTGWGDKGPKSPEVPLDCGNSGTTTRLMLGMLSSYDIDAELTGDASLVKRPMQRVTSPLSMMGATFEKTGDGQNPKPWTDGPITLPLIVHGKSGLKAITYASPKASAQVKSSIMLAALRSTGHLVLTEPYQSRNHTELMLPAFGAKLTAANCKVEMDGGQCLHASDVAVPGDPSSAMFIIVAAALTPDSKVEIANLGLNETRIAAIKAAQRMGVGITIDEGQSIGMEPTGTVTIEYSPDIKPLEVTPDEVPNLIDEIPILALLCTAAKGQSVFHEVSELRVKESNRLAAIVDGLCKLGCDAREVGDDLLVGGAIPSNSITLDSRGDHRLAMTWYLANRCFGLAGNVLDLDCIDVSYPDFIEELNRLSN